MADDIQFGTLHPDGTLTNQRAIPKAAIAACPQYILVPEHYREDGRRAHIRRSIDMVLAGGASA